MAKIEVVRPVAEVKLVLTEEEAFVIAALVGNSTIGSMDAYNVYSVLDDNGFGSGTPQYEAYAEQLRKERKR